MNDRERDSAGVGESLTEVTELDPRVPAAERADGGTPILSWHDADGAHREPVHRRTVVGQSRGAGLRVPDPRASRLHCELEPRADGVWVRDLASSNGTWVGGVRVERARLDPGAILRVGDTDLLMHVERGEPTVERWPDARFGELFGGSPRMRELFAEMARVAMSSRTVLIEGETGTGKELVARALHDASPRGLAPYVVVDCGALPEPLLESELFGHAKGAFTGATHARDGALLEAHGGTVFLDEIGELPLAMQPKLLRFIESRTVRRVGESQRRQVDVRVIAATHRDLATMVNDGTFREDLYFRLAVVPLHVPPLRDRREDIPSLVRAFLGDAASALLTPELLDDLMARSWPGNVRELRNYVDRLATLGPAATRRLEQRRASADGSGGQDGFPAVRADESLVAQRERWMSHLEREFLVAAMREHGGNVARVAQAAGLHRSHVYRLLIKYEI
ncbi:MAG: sigma 54-interacting transcriptional regulator [Sandaracinaceae bacterium]